MQAQGYREADVDDAVPESTGDAAVDCTMVVRLWRSFLVQRAQGMTAGEQFSSLPPEQRAYAGKMIRAAYRVDSAIVTNPERRGAYLMRMHSRCERQYEN